MIYYIIAMLAFALYFIYDVNSVTIKNPVLNRFFMAGTLILLIENVVIMLPLIEGVNPGISEVLLIVSSLVFFGLLIYTLFFSLPFETTYVEISENRKAVRTGMYGLARHIGVLWFILMYICLLLLFNDTTFTVFAIICSALNLIYVIFQDNYTFIKLFDDYEDYKKEVPFMIPGANGIRR